MNMLNVGIIGAGRIGQLHASNILSSSLLNLKGISDIHIEHLKGTIYEQKVPVITTDPEKIFQDPEVDAVFICSSTDTHLNFIKSAAKAGKHILCEKPISFNLGETEEALQAVKEAGVKFQVGFNRRFDKHFRKVCDTVQAGKIGSPHIIKVSSRDPEPPPEEYVKRSGGMFMDMTIHDFDMVRYLSGSEVIDVSVKAANLVDPMFGKNGDVDTAVITLTFENGAIAVIDNSRQAVYGYDQRIEVFGDSGAVSAENEAQTNVQIATKESVTIDHPKHFFLDRYKDAYIEEINQFAKAILEDKPLLCTGEDGYKAELLALAASVSWKEKRSVSLSEVFTVTAT
ncbi:inositol 2-dehydrogenase [Alteribacillus sp. YIM 98480]|uniref:inositol 2-dehydrogenase n=1 Tax=Alteribacillus sp. YIM 98480 TaxID=2606599 RepID=UPI00131D0412|nr:inositol 2-dehydrogenase [Alteribacillus sp. YIM 98480]